MRRLTLILILVLSFTASAQIRTPPHKPLLGPAANGTIKRTKLGIAYVANDFDRPRTKRLAKGEAYLRKHKIPEYVVTEFDGYATEAGDPAWIPTAIDRTFKEYKKKWLACGAGSKPARTVSAIDPRSIKVIVEPVAFWVEYHKSYANGMVETDGRTIHAVFVGVNYMSIPEQASLVRFDALMTWEIGNLFAMRAGWKIKTVDDEIGSNSPCQKIR